MRSVTRRGVLLVVEAHATVGREQQRAMAWAAVEMRLVLRPNIDEACAALWTVHRKPGSDISEVAGLRVVVTVLSLATRHQLHYT